MDPLCQRGARVTELNGIAGSWYEEGDLDHPASGLSSRSYVMTLPALTAVLQASGFGAVRMIDDVPDNQPYPAVTLVAETSSDVRVPNRESVPQRARPTSVGVRKT